jgi:hypothetical protein
MAASVSFGVDSNQVEHFRTVGEINRAVFFDAFAQSAEATAQGVVASGRELYRRPGQRRGFGAGWLADMQSRLRC